MKIFINSDEVDVQEGDKVIANWTPNIKEIAIQIWRPNLTTGWDDLVTEIQEKL